MSNYAIIKTGGKQVKVEEGSVIYVEKLNVEAGQTVTFDEAVALIEKKREEEKNRIIKTFPENSDLEILNGRFGPYIAYKGKNYKIPKGNKPEELSNDDCMKIIESDSKPKAKRAPRKK